MSGPRLSALDGKGANLVPLAKREVVGNLLGLTQGLEERAGPQTPTDNEPANPVGDVNQAVDNFDRWRLFQKDGRVQCSIAFKHLSDPSLQTSEQREVEPDFINQFNILTFDKVGFLPTVPFGRQTTGSVASCNAVGLTTQPANDRGWHPLDAA